MENAVATVFKKVSVESALDELLGSVVAGGGLIGASFGMKMLNGKVNQWVTPAIAIALGYGVRLAVKEDTKDIMAKSARDAATGVLLAGTLDLAKKVLTKVAGTNEVAQSVISSIPQLSGPDPETARYTGEYIPQNLRGGYGNASVLNSTFIRN